MEFTYDIFGDHIDVVIIECGRIRWIGPKVGKPTGIPVETIQPLTRAYPDGSAPVFENAFGRSATETRVVARVVAIVFCPIARPVECCQYPATGASRRRPDDTISTLIESVNRTVGKRIRVI